MRLAHEPDLVAHSAGKHRRPRAVARSCNRVPTIARHADLVQLAFDRGAVTRCVGHKDDETAICANLAQCLDRLRVRMHTVMHATPEIDEIGVVGRRKFR